MTQRFNPRLITSASNPRIKSLVRLQKRAAERRATGLFCVETPRILSRARAAGLVVRALYFDPQRFTDWPLLHELGPLGTELFELTTPLLNKIAYRQNPSGFVAVLEGRSTALEQLDDLTDPFLVVCSGLEKPGNLGAILRSADGAGVDAVVVDGPVDLYNPNSVRASTGAVFSVPVVSATSEILQAWLERRGVQMVAAVPDAPQLYTDADLTGALAIVLGSEAHGLTASWQAAAQRPVRLPMHGLADSLNVSVAAAVLMYEAARQRSSL